MNGKGGGRAISAGGIEPPYSPELKLLIGNYLRGSQSIGPSWSTINDQDRGVGSTLDGVATYGAVEIGTPDFSSNEPFDGGGGDFGGAGSSGSFDN